MLFSVNCTPRPLDEATGGPNLLEAPTMEQHPKIDPAVKAWLDDVLIPAMVRQYLAVSRDVVDNGVNLISSVESDRLTSEKAQ